MSNDNGHGNCDVEAAWGHTFTNQVLNPSLQRLTIFQPRHSFRREALRGDSVAEAAILIACMLKFEVKIFPSHKISSFVVMQCCPRPRHNDFSALGFVLACG